MKFDDLEVGGLYWVRWWDDSLRIAECRAGSDHKYLRFHNGMDITGEQAIADITPVPDRETWEACVAAMEAIIEWHDRDGSVGGLVEPIDIVRSALAKARGE